MPSKLHSFPSGCRPLARSQDYICSLNFKYRTDLREKGVKYLNAHAKFIDAHTVELKDKKGAVTTATADKIIVATGGRPKYLGLENERECVISSDDLFSLQTAPGKTLVVGASYVALECAGFLAGLKYDTTVMMRSIPLRGFDQQCAERICDYMVEHGTKFIRGAIPAAVEKLPSGKIKVSWKPSSGDGPMESDEYDTVLVAVGRTALTDECGCANAGIEVSPSSKKIIGKGMGVGGTEQSNVENIFAIGDVLEGYPELTPVAIAAGQLLARRLFGGSSKQMDYVNIPTTVFTPVEYGVCGLRSHPSLTILRLVDSYPPPRGHAPCQDPLPWKRSLHARWMMRTAHACTRRVPCALTRSRSEEDAIVQYGEADIEVYHTAFKPLELTVPGRGDNASYVKVICQISAKEKIIGMHYLGWNAGEIIQGFGIGMKLGATKADLDDLVGIHPTAAEVFTTLTVTKRSGGDFMAAGC